ncbi:hypothetical protein D3C87_1427890 [compost metagenome]
MVDDTRLSPAMDEAFAGDAQDAFQIGMIRKTNTLFCQGGELGIQLRQQAFTFGIELGNVKMPLGLEGLCVQRFDVTKDEFHAVQILGEHGQARAGPE